MKSQLFTELTQHEEVNLSGGTFKSSFNILGAAAGTATGGAVSVGGSASSGVANGAPGVVIVI